MRERDLTEPVTVPARKARCPKCGQIGMRRFFKPYRSLGNGVWIFEHERVASKIIPGVFEGVQCFVPAAAPQPQDGSKEGP